MFRTAVPLVLLTLGAEAALAQPAPPTPPLQQSPGGPPNSNANKDSSDQACAPRAGAGSPTVGSGQSGSDLGDRLARSNGVICPPADVDPQMRVPAPQQGGRMPVIPPPGSPGGAPNAVPK